MLPVTGPTDSELVQRAQAGDKGAFDALVTRNESKVYGLCLKMLGNPEDAEDVLQEVFIKAYQSLPGFRGDSAFSTWLYRIATNACLMRIRKKKLETVSLDQPSEDDGDGTRDVADWSRDPAAEVMNDELRAVLAEHINELAPDNRIVFVLRDIHGLSTEDTAKVLGLTTPAVKSRLHRARLYLRERLSDYFSRGALAA
ncbi:MAG: sigma-70 family RNA polymerase sigma factor [Candidatus Eisenbacteria bacterium]|nr:sigma-70 family RNA polymerase sigma factor [Candidatus Eisenbacteria bacterium]